MTDEQELNEVISQWVTNKGIVEIVRISHSAIPTQYLAYQVASGTQFTDENGGTFEVTFANMSLSAEKDDSNMLGERTLAIQGANDIIADIEDQIPPDSDELIKVSILNYVVDMNNNISGVAAGPYNYWIGLTTYTQENNTVTLSLTTTPTNTRDCGFKITIAKFPTAAGLQS